MWDKCEIIAENHPLDYALKVALLLGKYLFVIYFMDLQVWVNCYATLTTIESFAESGDF